MYKLKIYLIDNEKVEIYGLLSTEDYEFKCVPRVGEQLSLNDDLKDVVNIFAVVSVVYPLELDGNKVDLYVKYLGLHPEFEDYLIRKHVDAPPNLEVD